MGIRVLVTKRFYEKDLDYLNRRLHPSVEIVFPEEYSKDALESAVDHTIDALLGEVVTERMLIKGTSLKLIQIPWTGVDRVDFDLLSRYHVWLCNSHSNAPVVAEYTVALLLAVMKQIPVHDSALRQGEWRRPGGSTPFTPPVLLAGKTVCLVGYGAIAQGVATRLSSFSCRLIAVARAAHLMPPPPLVGIYQSADLPRLLPECDVIIVALPLTPDTQGMFNAQMFQHMRSSAYFINISRGEIVNETDLFEALSQGRITGAGIDTWYSYPSAANPVTLPSQRYPFHQLENLVLSPHRAGFAQGHLPHLDDASDNLNRLAKGQPLINRVEFDRKY